MNCPDPELLSSFVDGETSAAEGLGVDAHAASCGECRLRLKSMRAVKAALAACPVPAMPADLRESLRAMAPRREPFWRVWLAELHAGLRHRAAAAALAAAACFALMLWARHAGILVKRVDVPADLLAAAHNQYILTMPLAPSETILTEMPMQLAGSWPEGRDVY